MKGIEFFLKKLERLSTIESLMQTDTDSKELS
jgi:hypothetical protein